MKIELTKYRIRSLFVLTILIVQTSVLPLWKFLEKIYGLPPINFGAFRLILFTISILFFFFGILKFNKSLKDYLFISSYILFTIVFVINISIYFESYAFREIYTLRIDSILISSILFYFAGKYYSPEMKKILNLIFYITTIVILVHYKSLLSMMYLSEPNSDPLNYIFLSDPLLFLYLLIQDKNRYDYLKLVIIFLVILLLPSRSNFVLLILVTLYSLFTSGRLSKVTNVAITSILLLGLLGLLLLFFKDTRLNIFEFNLDDSSFSTRTNYLTTLSWSAIPIGNFFIDVHTFGSSGKNIHNILFILNQFGILSFIIVLTLIGLLIRDNFYSKKQLILSLKELHIWNMITALFFKSILYPYLWFSLGKNSNK